MAGSQDEDAQAQGLVVCQQTLARAVARAVTPSPHGDRARLESRAAKYCSASAQAVLARSTTRRMSGSSGNGFMMPAKPAMSADH